MQPKFKKLPKFESEEAEREFWSSHDSTEYLNWSKAIKNPSFPNLKRTEGLLYIVLPNTIQQKLERIATQKHIPSERLAAYFIREGMISNTWQSLVGLISGFLLSALSIFLSYKLILNGHDYAGVIIVTVTTVGLAGTYIYGTRRQRKERNPTKLAGRRKTASSFSPMGE